MVKVLNITISDLNFIFLFCLLLCYPLTTVAWDTKSIHIPGYCIYKVIEVVETQISLEFS